MFRHSLATALRDAGYDANAIARVLGHSDPSFTQRTYIHEASIVRFDELFNYKLGDRPDGAEDNHRGQPAGGTGGESHDTPPVLPLALNPCKPEAGSERA